MEILGKILGTPGRVKIMRLFILNRGKGFNAEDVSKRSQVRPAATRKELRLLQGVGFIKKGGVLWRYNGEFKYGAEFADLLLSTSTLSKEDILNHFKKAGKIKLLVISGVFIKNRDSRADILIVGNNLNKRKIDDVIKKMEAEIGMELTYAIFETKEFLYRLEMYDKLVRDILDYPHEVILESKELSTRALRKS